MRHITFILLLCSLSAFAQTDTTYYRISQPDNGIVTLTTVEITAGREVVTKDFLTDSLVAVRIDQIDRELENYDTMEQQYLDMITQMQEEVIRHRRQRRDLARKRERLNTRLSRM
jgi:hypothetical protein